MLGLTVSNQGSQNNEENSRTPNAPREVGHRRQIHQSVSQLVSQLVSLRASPSPPVRQRIGFIPSAPIPKCRLGRPAMQVMCQDGIITYAYSSR